MLFPDQQTPRGLPSESPPPEDDGGGLFYVDFGPLFGQEVLRVLKYRETGMLAEIVFWQDGYSF
jgi:hypothetical protein